MSSQRRWRQIQRLGEGLPVVHCKRLCGRVVCGAVPLTEVELEVIHRFLGVKELVQKSEQCPLYWEHHGGEGCQVYEFRPLICKMWGVVEGMECQFGCEAEPRLLTREEGYELLKKCTELGNGKVVTMALNQYMDFGDENLAEVCMKKCQWCDSRAVVFSFNTETGYLVKQSCLKHQGRLKE